MFNIESVIENFKIIDAKNTNEILDQNINKNGD